MTGGKKKERKEISEHREEEESIATRRKEEEGKDREIRKRRTPREEKGENGRKAVVVTDRGWEGLEVWGEWSKRSSGAREKILIKCYECWVPPDATLPASVVFLLNSIGL